MNLQGSPSPGAITHRRVERFPFGSGLPLKKPQKAQKALSDTETSRCCGAAGIRAPFVVVGNAMRSLFVEMQEAQPKIAGDVATWGCEGQSSTDRISHC